MTPKVPRGTHPTGPEQGFIRVVPRIPRPNTPWVCADALGVEGVEYLSVYLNTLTARERAAGYAHIDSLAVAADVAPPPSRRRYGRAALIGGFVGALLMGWAWTVYGQSLPDPNLTPGAVASTDRAEICTWVGGLSYSKRHRVWTDKAGTLEKYGLPLSDTYLYEDDDRVPVCAGGDNTSPLNHWTQPWPEAHIKDQLEAQICRAICAGRMTPQEGQAIFLGDWRSHLGEIRR